MKTLPPIVEDMFGDLLRERERERIQEAEEVGEVVGTRTSLLRLYTKRLGAPSSEIVARLESIDNIETLYAMLDRYDEPVESWEQLLP